ncbi:MAG: hypothetical protein KatS3mg023_0475 [Armatimonadota bacterium]|nr:MAG: hypothetical protein KatS3mg023_0475 [Armatimonadota bacterium]
MKPVFAILIMVAAVALCVRLCSCGSSEPRGLSFALPEDDCSPVRVDETHRELIRRYRIPIDDKSPYVLSVERYRAFGKPCYRAVLSTVLPSRSRLLEWHSITLHETAAYASAEQAVREAAEWWNGCH